jgi:alpha-D-ribose 1-methylphosphonate 5-triphosphate synthase subunit PhnH
MSLATAALAPGFRDPVRDAQSTFRAVMEALARPGSLQRLIDLPAAPEPLTPELAAIALALADHETPLWLDARLSGLTAVADWLRFHTGAPIVADPAGAAFALIADPAACPPPEAFAQGTQDYPDRSATLVLAVAELTTGQGLVLEGPGIAGRAVLGAAPLPTDFRARLERNRAGTPLGVDHLLVGTGRVAGLPRTTRILGAA